MTESGEPPSAGGREFLLFLITVLVGGMLFLAFSFLTFGLPLVVLALAAGIWIYVGIMRLLDRLLERATSRRRARH